MSAPRGAVPAGGTGTAGCATTETSSQLYRDIANVARTIPSDELATILDALVAEVAFWQALPDLDDGSRDVALDLVGTRVAAVRDELHRRETLARAGVCASPSRHRDYQDWHTLAQAVRDRADCRDVLTRNGWVPAQQGRDEMHGPCLACGGTDRLVVWRHRAWCRQCGWSGDAIAIARVVWRCTFREAVRRLAEGVAA